MSCICRMRPKRIIINNIITWYFLHYSLNYAVFISIPFDSSFTRERLLNELRETEEASRRQAEVLVKVSLVKISRLQLH